MMRKVEGNGLGAKVGGPYQPLPVIKFGSVTSRYLSPKHSITSTALGPINSPSSSRAEKKLVGTTNSSPLRINPSSHLISKYALASQEADIYSPKRSSKPTTLELRE